MLKELDIYKTFKKVEAEKKGKEVRLPSSIPKNLSDDNKNILSIITVYFNTKWANIDPEQYFNVGFSLWKTFSIPFFLREDIIKTYIAKDKSRKFNTKFSKQTLLESLKYVKKSGGVCEYCNTYYGVNSRPVLDYVRGKIDKFLLTYFIKYSILNLKETDKVLIPEVIENMRELSIPLLKHKKLFDGIKNVC